MPGGWWCCCGGDCFEFLDDFGRDDSTDPGASWYESKGDWGIKSDKLVEEWTA